jgi:hypothetical protein
MNRILPLLALAAFSAAASAQCFETNFGTSIGLGDDTLLAAVPMNINFPMGGNVYTDIRPNTNGVAFLESATSGTLGTTGTGYSTSAATMATNMVGAAGGVPRIACYWRDLNYTAANGGAVYVNNTIPGKCVVTWDRGVMFGQASPIFTIQAQLFDTGEVQFFYDGLINNTTLGATCGVSVGGGVANPGASDLSVPSVGVSTSPIVFETFATLNTFDLRTTNVSFMPNAGNGYDVTQSACVPASNTNYGAGCYNISGTVYERFEPGTVDLAGLSVHLTPNGQGGYLVTPGFGQNFVHTTASLGLGDDATALFTMPSAFSFPGGSTTDLRICSNGFIWLNGTSTSADFSPSTAELFSNPARICPLWADGVPDGATGVQNVFAEYDVVTNKVYVTYVNIPIFGGVGGILDVQTELDLGTGEIEHRYGASLSCGNVSYFAWAPGTGVSSVDPGSRDVSADLPFSFQTQLPEAFPIALSGQGNPVVGGSVTFQTDNLPASSLLSIYLLSTGQSNPGIDLGVIGAGGCSAYVTLPEVLSAVQLGGPSASTTISIPNDPFFAGFSFYSQAVALNPTANPAGVMTTNGVASFMNSF